jgi:hypothetical protein
LGRIHKILISKPSGKKHQSFRKLARRFNLSKILEAANPQLTIFGGKEESSKIDRKM